ncbi:MAG: hypothetical protein ACI8TQ_000576 [Planctomycetota bacterium]|jgi:hypothetical protein
MSLRSETTKRKSLNSMSMHGEISASDALELLNLAMRELLEAVDSNSDDTEVLLASWSRCQFALQRFDEKIAAIVTPSPEERAAINEHLQTAVRLNAIATHLVQRESERIGVELAAVSEAKRKLQAQMTRSSDSGGSVDLAG